MSVQRFRLARPKGAGAAYMAEDSGGNWVEIATVAALEERVAELEGLLRDVEITEVPIQNGTVDVVVFGLVEGKGKYEATNDWAERVRAALAPTEEGGRR